MDENKNVWSNKSKIIYYSQISRWLYISNLKLRKDSKGNYFVYSNTRVITINEKLLNNALLNDIVIVETDSLSNLKNCGKVKKIIKRHNSLLVVDYNIVDNKPCFKPVNNFFIEILLI